jgi:hypothetical protein
MELAFELKTHLSCGVEPVEAPDITTLVPASALTVRLFWIKSVWGAPLLMYETENTLPGERGVDCPVGSNVMEVAGEPEGVKSVVRGLPSPVTKS